MSDRRPDDEAPLAPRRPLGAPAASPATAEPDAPADQVAGQDASTPPSPPARAKRASRARTAKKTARPRGGGTAGATGAARGGGTDGTARGDTGAAADPGDHAGPDTDPGPARPGERAEESGGAPTVTMARVTGPDAATRTPAGRTAVSHGPATDGSAPAPAAPAAAPQATASRRTRGKQTRKARLRMVRIDPWSVMKMAFALSIALAVVTVIAVAIVWSVLDAAGVWDSINTSLASLQVDPNSTFDVREYVGIGRVMGLTLVVAAADVVLLTALATLGAFMYNLAAALLGGFEVTLAEDR